MKRVGTYLILGFIGLLTLTAGCKKAYNWNITLREEGKQPYDLYVFTQLLKNAVGSDQYYNPEYDLLNTLDQVPAKTLYISAGFWQSYSPEEMSRLREFVNRGGSVLVVSGAFQQVLADSLCDLNLLGRLPADSVPPQSLRLSSFNDSIPILKHTGSGKASEMYYKVQNRISPVNWEYYSDSVMQAAKARKRLLLNNTYPIAIEMPSWKGKVIFMSEALPLTNYHMKNEDNFEVINSLMDDFDFEAVIFDRSRRFQNMQQSDFDQSPLFYFFKFKGFRFAWLTLLALVLLYLLFNYKRRTRVMQLMPDKSNKSLMYVETISLMYYKNRAHLAIAKIAAKIFLFDVRRKYRINTSKLDDDFVELLAEKTNLPYKSAKLMRDKIHALKGINQLSEEGFLSFFQLLNRFKKVIHANG